MIGVAMAAFSIGTSILGAGKAKKAAKANQQVIRLQGVLASAENDRSRRSVVRDAYIAQGANIGQGAGQGGFGGLASSNTQGQDSSIKSQFGYNARFLAGGDKTNKQIQNYGGQAARLQGQAALFNTASQVSGAFASATGGFEQLGQKLGVTKIPGSGPPVSGSD